MAKWCFGIDLGGTTVKCALFQTDGTVEEKWEIVTRTENNGEAILPDIAATILAKIEEKKIDKAELQMLDRCTRTGRRNRRNSMRRESSLGKKEY